MWYFTLVEPVSSSAIGPDAWSSMSGPFTVAWRSAPRLAAYCPWMSAASILNARNVALRHRHAPVRRQRVWRDRGRDVLDAEARVDRAADVSLVFIVSQHAGRIEIAEVPVGTPLERPSIQMNIRSQTRDGAAQHLRIREVGGRIERELIDRRATAADVELSIDRAVVFRFRQRVDLERRSNSGQVDAGWRFRVPRSERPSL